jgi:uncharacterized protein YdbL (DUF1318 family)
MKATTIGLAGLFCLMLAVTASADNDELKKLKGRFKARYATLVKLKAAGKVGETYRGDVKAVKAAYLVEKVAAEGEKTVKTFLEEENKDRGRLYVLLAKQAGTTPAKVAERAVKRNFQKAAAEHYLQTKADTWVQKKDYKPKPK